MLELQLNPVTKFYSAPVQMKANNGALIIDDFGRQRVRPEELLNRWVVGSYTKATGNFTGYSKERT
jgi:hypothetical protein